VWIATWYLSALFALFSERLALSLLAKRWITSAAAPLDRRRTSIPRKRWARTGRATPCCEMPQANADAHAQSIKEKIA
jgi:hypothetical protein